MYFWLRRVFTAPQGLSTLAGPLYLGRWGFSLGSTGWRACRLLRFLFRALELNRLNSGAWAQLLCGMWDLHEPGIELVSLALAGRFFTTKENVTCIQVIVKQSDSGYMYIRGANKICFRVEDRLSLFQFHLSLLFLAK